MVLPSRDQYEFLSTQTRIFQKKKSQVVETSFYELSSILNEIIEVSVTLHPENLPPDTLHIFYF
jgi:hypothetical protein